MIKNLSFQCQSAEILVSLKWLSDLGYVMKTLRKIHPLKVKRCG